MEIRKSYWSKFLVLKRRKKLIISILILVILLALYNSDKVMIDIPKKTMGHVKEKTNLDFFPLWSKWTGYLFSFEDEINPFRIKKNLLDGNLPIYSLELSPNDLKHFDNLSKDSIELGYLSADANKWRSARLEVDGKKYKIEVSLHGDTPTQWSKSLKSYQIKTDKEEFINRMRRFNLIIFEDKFFDTVMFRVIASKLGLMDVRDNIVVLKINGVIQGVYYLQEALDNNFLEYNGCSGCYIIKNTDNWVEDHNYAEAPYGLANDNGIVIAGTGHVTAFDYEISNIDLDDSTDARKVMYNVEQLSQAVKNNDPKVTDYFDKDYLSSFEAFRMLVGDTHLIEGDNLKMAYSSANGKFYPIPIGEIIGKLEVQKGGLEHHLNTYLGQPLKLFFLIAKDDEIRYLRNKKIYGLITNNTLLKGYDDIIKKYVLYVASYKTNDYNSRILKYYLRDLRNILEYNMVVIKRNLEYSKFYANIFNKGNKITIELIPDSMAEIKFKNLKINLSEDYKGEIKFVIYKNDNFSINRTIRLNDETSMVDLTDLVKDLYFSAGLDENLYPQLQKYRFEITFADSEMIDLANVDIKMKNDITGYDIADNDAYIKIADGNDYYENSKYSSIDELKKKFSQFKWDYKDDELTLMEGNYMLYEDMIIPRTKKLIIEPGTKIAIAENKSILSYSPAVIAGTREKPIRITSIDKNMPFGTFAIVGENKQGETAVINWLDISGGKDRWLNGMFFIGQLAIYNVPEAYINNTLVHGSHGDDGVNIKFANVLIENSKFYGNYADQVDLDFVRGVIKNNEFNGKGELDSNGDGLDLSGSRIIIKNNIFTNLLDKGISIGEDTKAIVYKNSIINNNLGTAVKDLSQAHFLENTFAGNEIAITVYQKKQLFGGSFAYVYKNSFSTNTKDFEQDNVSTIGKISNGEDYKKLKENAEKEIINFSG